jgi:hypothetical protein
MIKVISAYMVQNTGPSSATTVECFLQEVLPREDRKHLLVGLGTEWYRVAGRN